MNEEDLYAVRRQQFKGKGNVHEHLFNRHREAPTRRGRDINGLTKEERERVEDIKWRANHREEDYTKEVWE